MKCKIHKLNENIHCGILSEKLFHLTLAAGDRDWTPSSRLHDLSASHLQCTTQRNSYNMHRQLLLL